MITALNIGLKVCLQVVWEKEDLQDRKHDKKLDGNELPKGFAHNHGFESVSVKGIDTR
jgi:hypothetical protein